LQHKALQPFSARFAVINHGARTTSQKAGSPGG
jgi:hypothetical protein